MIRLILVAIEVFGFLILIHEFGHFFVAKLNGITVHEFSIGMGPLLLKFQKGETLYSLRLFPIGGYCALEGEDEESINEVLSLEAARIAQQEDSLVTHFIIDNFDNVLGPGVFMMMTGSYPYPVLTPQIEDIMSKATKKFKSENIK